MPRENKTLRHSGEKQGRTEKDAARHPRRVVHKSKDGRTSGQRGESKKKPEGQSLPNRPQSKPARNRPPEHAEQRGRGVSESHLLRYKKHAKAKASELLRHEGLLSQHAQKAIEQGACEDADVRVIAHILKILVNVENKAALCAGPHICPVEDLKKAEPLLMRETRASMSQSARNSLDSDKAALTIVKPLEHFLHSRGMRDACEDKDGVVERMRQDVRRRWKDMLRLRPRAENVWKQLARADPAFAASIDAAASRSWKTLLLTALAMGGVVGAGFSAEKLRQDPKLRAKLYAAATEGVANAQQQLTQHTADVAGRLRKAGGTEGANIAQAARRLAGATPAPKVDQSWISRNSRVLLTTLGGSALLLALERSGFFDAPKEFIGQQLGLSSHDSHDIFQLIPIQPAPTDEDAAYL